MNSNIILKINQMSKHYGSTRLSPDYVLKNINLTVKKGDRIGLIGNNGAGKTTLLKLIAKVIQPSEGQIEHYGRVVSLLNIGAGFDPDLTGHENIILNGVFSGLTSKEIRDNYQEIVSFSELKNKINDYLYTYSDGMKFRLAFAIASVAKPDLLLIDEIFMAGDVDFQQKTAEKIIELQKSDHTSTIISSHIPNAIWRFSNTFYTIKGSRLQKTPESKVAAWVKEVENKMIATYGKVQHP